MNPMKHKTISLPYQLRALIENSAHLTRIIVVCGDEYEFKSVSRAEAALGELMIAMLAYGADEGINQWVEAGDVRMATPPAGWPELRWASSTRTVKRLMPRGNKGAWCSPFSEGGWCVTDAEPNGGPIYVTGTLKQCLLWGRMNGLDLDGDAFTSDHLDADVLRALVASDIHR